MDASVPIISLSFRQTTLRQACNNVRCSLPRQTGNAFPAGNGIKHKTRKATSKSSCCRLSYSSTASYIFPAVFCGKRGIRTPGALQLNGFQDRRNRPLCHLSGHKKYNLFFDLSKPVTGRYGTVPQPYRQVISPRCRSARRTARPRPTACQRSVSADGAAGTAPRLIPRDETTRFGFGDYF